MNNRSIQAYRRSLCRAVLLVLTLSWPARCGDPVFDAATLMRLVLVPADAAVGSVIYRIRAHDQDFDYPLQFDMIGDTGRSDVSVETLPCTRYNSVCQANVILQRRLEPGRYVDFRVSVRNTKGRTNRISCSITATNATTPRDTIFPHIPALIMVQEDAKRGTELDYIVARKNPLQSKPVYLELWGSPLFAIRQKIVSTENTEGTIFLIGPLDFETQSMYHLTVLANDAYAEPSQDTRNIAGVEVVIVVQDVQDMPPVFTSAPPVTHLQPNLVPGDIVVRVHAEDGDKGAPRQIRYGLVSEGNPFTTFFNINETTGDVTLERPLDDIAAISHVGSPVLLTVIAEEVKIHRDEPEAMSATVQLAFIMPERGNSPPYFENDFYIARINENSPQGTALVFADPYIPQVNDDDPGKNGVFSLTLAGNNGTFEISPSVGERRANFLIKVRDNGLLDYEERKSVIFQIVAQELGPATNLSTSVNVTVYLNDVNDNAPTFLEDSYEVELAENATAGTRVVQVKAQDVDTGVFGKVQYTAILGYLNTSLHLDPKSGIITVATNNHGFDREAMPDIRYLVEARDNDGIGNRATVPLIIKLLDVNDETPEFERTIYEFILAANLRNFTSPAIIKAIDKDAEPPNNIVRYELILGNFENKFALNEITGELYLLEPLKKSSPQTKRRIKRQFGTEQESEFYVLTARAYDLGVPHRYSMTTIRVYPPESKTRTMLFVVPGLKPDREKTEQILSTITGGKVTITEIRPYKGTEVGVTDVTAGSSGKERSVVVATVLSTGNSLVDVSHIQQQLNNNKTIAATAAVSSGDATVTVYKAENQVLFWLLIFLAICITLALISLIFCCICSGCPLYMPPRKRVIRVNSTDDDVHLVVREKGRGKESKSVQAAEWYGRREAWSAQESDARTKPTQWRFNRRNNKSKESADLAVRSDGKKGKGELFTPTAANNEIKIEDRHSIKLREGPNIIYTKEMQNGNDYIIERNIYMEDMDREYARIAGYRGSNKNLHKQTQEDADADSLRRHEMERGSDVEYVKQDVDKVSIVRHNSLLNVRIDESNNDHRGPSSVIDGRDQLFIKEGNTEILRLVTRGGLEEERYVNVPRTQQMRPTMMPNKYVVVDNGKDILMQRYIEDQGDEVKNMRAKLGRQNTTFIQNEKGYVEESHLLRAGNEQVLSNSIHPNQIDNNYQNLDMPIPGSVQPTDFDALHQRRTILSDNYPNSIHLRQEILETSLRQQNEILRQILLQKDKSHHYQDAASQFEAKLETQSLPGHSVMATQTECHTSTQTEPLNMRPAKRRARSDIDESFSEEEYEMYIDQNPRKIKWIKRKKPKKRKAKYKEEHPKRSINVEKVKRKIRTPIMEETDLSIELENDKHSKKSSSKDEYHKVYGEKQDVNLRKIKIETTVKKQPTSLDNERPVRSALKKEILIEISKSLDEPIENTDNKSRPKLIRQAASTKFVDTDESASDDNIEQYEEARRNSDEFTDDSLERKSISEKDLSSSKRTDIKKDKRNSVFSRQGSSTDAKDASVNTDEKLSKLYFSSPNSKSSTEKKGSIDQTSVQKSDVEEKNLRNISTSELTETPESDSKKHGGKEKPTDTDFKKPTDKSIDVSKSVPRYMQWYNKNNAQSSQQEKVIPAKPKRIINNKIVKDGQVLKKLPDDDASKKKSSHKQVTSDKVIKSQLDPKKSKQDGKERNVKVHPRFKEDQVKPIPEGPLPDTHPRLQHSEHRYEREYQNQNPMCFIQPTHLPQYFGNQPEEPTAAVDAVSNQPLYINQIPVNTQSSLPSVMSQGGQPTTVYLNSSDENRDLQIPQNPDDRLKNIISESPNINSSTNISSKEINVSVKHFKGVEDDDSGIAMTSLLAGQTNSQNVKRLPITEKQSVFTIAYNDVHTKQLRPDSSTPSF